MPDAFSARYRGSPDFRNLGSYLHKPATALPLGFTTQDPYIGMSSEKFSGNAVMFLSSISVTSRAIDVAAFDDAVKAGQDLERQKNEGQAYANDVIPRARGDSARLREQAEGYKARVIATAEGNGPVNALDKAFRAAVGNRRARQLQRVLHGPQMTVVEGLEAADQDGDLGMEMADILFVLVCMANREGIDLNDAFDRMMHKVEARNADRFRHDFAGHPRVRVPRREPWRHDRHPRRRIR